MKASWYSAALPRTTSSRFCDNTSKVLIKLLAALGIIVFIERTASFYTFTARDRYQTAGGSSVQSFHSHPLDALLLHTSSLNSAGLSLNKAIVVASITSEDTSWIQKHLSDWQDNIYVVDDVHANLTVFNGNGREAAVYLTYIINHYYDLPDYIAFLHAQRYQWHNDDPMYDGVVPMKNLRLERVKDTGYVSLRCSWDPGCPTQVQPDPDHVDGLFGYFAAYAHAFEYVFPERDLPEEVAAPCCAQFVVTREVITKTPLQTWERARQWLWDTNIGNEKSGRVMEYMWHILMGEAALSCPTAEECYCKTFGLCDLQCDLPGACEGRYYLPPWNEKMPQGWPFEGQGTHGYPQYGWWKKYYPEEDFGLAYIESGFGADIDDPSDVEDIPDIGIDPDELVASVMGEPLSKAPNMEPELEPIKDSAIIDADETDDDDNDLFVNREKRGKSTFLDEVVGKIKHNGKRRRG